MVKKNSYQSGLFAEFLAKMYLRLHGFKIVKSRYITGKQTGRAEIDIIARRNDLMVFIEVKRRKSIDIAMDSISTKQAVRLRRSAETYLLKTKWMGRSRFDMMCIVGWKIYWIKTCI